jgi:FtsP/CotA-like multicopper oxidase with cupredoxin domain
VMSAAQVGFGLSGALLVDDPAESRTVAVADELVLVLNDIALDKNGRLEDPNSGGTAGMAFGREGTNVLVNGREGAKLTVRSGAPQRWRVVNTAKSRYFQLDLPNEQFTIIGGDGGLQEFATTKRRVVLGPGERADLLVTPHARPGATIMLRALLFDRGYGSTEYRDDSDLLAFTMSPEPTLSLPALPRTTRVIEPLRAAGATPVRVKLTLAKRNDGLFEYGFDGVPGHKAEHIRARPGETQLWTVSNETPWSHPLHLHGFFFQAADSAGNPVHPIVWKDTYDIPYKQTRRLLVRFDDRVGEWMYHCHILDHAEGGLMSTVLLGDVKSKSH